MLQINAVLSRRCRKRGLFLQSPNAVAGLTFAASTAGDGDRVVTKSAPYLRCYVEDWGGKEGDAGVMARQASGRSIGAV